MIQKYLPSVEKGGVGYFAHALANALCERGHTVTMLSRDPAPEGAHYEVQKVHLPLIVHSNRLLQTYLFAWVVAQQDFSPFDLIHAHGDSHLLFRPCRPVLRTLHGSSLAEARYAHNWRRSLAVLPMYPCEILATLLARRTVGGSHTTLRHFPWVKEIVHYGVNLRHFRPGFAKSTEPSILFVGHLRDRKRGQRLVQVFQREVLPVFPSAELWMVCDEPISGPAIRWEGRVSEERLIELYQQAWVFCLPSAYEGFGIPYVEALACGTPVVATRNGGSAEVLGQGSYGVLTSLQQLGAALLQLLGDTEERQELARRGLERAQAFSLDKTVAAYERIYYDVLAEGR